MAKIQVFTAVAANGNSSEVTISNKNVVNDIGIYAAGTWGGGTATLQYKNLAGSWVSTSTTLTANGTAVNVSGVVGSALRINLAGATSPSLDAYIIVDGGVGGTTTTEN